MNEKKISVLFLNPIAMMGGAEHSFLSLLKKLDPAFKTYLLLPENGPLVEKARQLDVEVSTWPELPRWREKSQAEKIRKTLKSSFKIKKLVEKKGINIIHVNSIRQVYVGGLAARLSRIPCLAHVRDIYLSPFLSSFKSWLIDLLADRLIAVSRATQQSIIQKKRKLISKTVVIYNGVNLAEIDLIQKKDIRKELSLREEDRLIGAFGQLHQVKGPSIIIRSLLSILRLCPQARLLFVGGVLHPEERFYEENLKKMVGELSLEKKAYFLGWREDNLAIMKSLDVVVHPAVYPEPFPRVLLEAAACSRPIVATAVGGVPEIITDGVSGLLVPPEEPQALSESILRILGDKEMARRLGEAARKKVETEFNLERHCQQIANLYKSLVKS